MIEINGFLLKVVPMKLTVGEAHLNLDEMDSPVVFHFMIKAMGFEFRFQLPREEVTKLVNGLIKKYEIKVGE